MSETPDPGPVTAVLPRIGDVPPPRPPVIPGPATPQTAADAADAPTVPTPPAAPRTPGRGAVVPIRGSRIATWLTHATVMCGEWASLTVSATTHTAVVVVDTPAAFDKWCRHLTVPKARRADHTDALGSYTQGVTTAHGWTITVHLPHPPARQPAQESSS
jgi:hypothetical protein